MRVFPKIFCCTWAVGCRKFVQYVRMLCPVRSILVESVLESNLSNTQRSWGGKKFAPTWDIVFQLGNVIGFLIQHNTFFWPGSYRCKIQKGQNGGELEKITKSTYVHQDSNLYFLRGRQGCYPLLYLDLPVTIASKSLKSFTFVVV